MTRKVLISAPSAAPALIQGTVTLYEQTWLQHVQQRHPEVLLGHIRQAMTDPCIISPSKTETGAYLLVNEGAKNDAGQVLRVPVRPMSDGTNIVTTAYYASAGTHTPILWRRGDG